MDKVNSSVLALRALQTKLLARFRVECLYKIDDKLKDYQIADFLGLSPTAFSLASTGVSTLSGPTFYRLICSLIGLSVDVFDYFELEYITLDFIKMTKSEQTIEIFNDGSAPPAGAIDNESGCSADCHGECSHCVNG